MTVETVRIRGAGGQVALLAIWAALSALAYPRPNLWVLAHFSLVPLILLALRGEPRWRVGVLVYLAAVAWWAGMIWWIFPVTDAGFFALTAYLGLYPLAFVLLLPAMQGRFNLPLTLSVPVLWVGLEYLRGGYVMTGFPWFLQGQSQPLYMIQPADLFGAYGVSFIVCMSNGFLADLLLVPLMVRRGGSDRPVLARSHIVRLAIMALVITSTVGYSIHRIRQSDSLAAEADRPRIRIAVVQSNVPQSNKESPTVEQDRENFELMVRLSRQALGDRPDLIVWPETSIPGALNREALEGFADKADRYARAASAATNNTARYEEMAAYFETLIEFPARVRALVGETGVPLLAGSHAYLRWNADTFEFHDEYNSAYLLVPGRADQRYDKVHRVPFGEYMPFVEGMPAAKDWVVRNLGPGYDFTIDAGRGFKVLEVEASGRPWRLTVPICYEDVMTYVPRAMIWDEDGKKRADVLINISNDGWYAGTAEGPQHEQIARFRCVENRVPMARSVNTGVSGFIDSAGRVIGRVVVDGQTQKVAGVATGQLWRDDRATGYSIFGDSLPVGCIVAAAVLLGIAAADQFTRRKPQTKRWDR